MTVGLGTGSTVAHLIPALAQRGLAGARFVASSPASAGAARAAGLRLVELEDVAGRLDITIDGADQIDPAGWLVKGGGGAHAREKVLAAAAARFVVIASAEKPVAALAPPVPLEIMRFAASYTLAALSPARLRDAPPSPDDNLIADYLGAVEDPRALAARLAGTPGVVAHGLFPPELVSDIFVGGPAGVEHHPGARAADGEDSASPSG
jgi:ribose 5-phosphate isomerase A